MNGWAKVSILRICFFLEHRISSAKIDLYDGGSINFIDYALIGTVSDPLPAAHIPACSAPLTPSSNAWSSVKPETCFRISEPPRARVTMSAWEETKHCQGGQRELDESAI
jgi:hypothetical protein